MGAERNMRREETPALRWGNVTRHPKSGELGARAVVRAKLGGWEATYYVHTHGKNSATVADEIAALDDHHAAWVARLTDCAAELDTEFVIGGETFRVTDFTIPVCQPGRRPRVIVAVARIVGPQWRTAAGFPMTFRYDSIADIPTNAAIISEVRAQLEARDEAAVAHETFIGKVQQKLDDAAARRNGHGG